MSREVARHGGRPAYRAHDADRQAWVFQRCGPKQCLLTGNRKLRNIVASKLILDWSPEQIAGWLQTRYPNNENMRVSHETIYRSLFIQARGVLKKELWTTCGRSGACAAHATSASTDIPGADRRCHLDPRTTGGGGRPSDSWSLGRRPGWRVERTATLLTLVERHSPLSHADQSAEQRNGSGGCCVESAGSETSGGSATLFDLGLADGIWPSTRSLR